MSFTSKKKDNCKAQTAILVWISKYRHEINKVQSFICNQCNFYGIRISNFWNMRFIFKISFLFFLHFFTVIVHSKHRHATCSSWQLSLFIHQ